MMAELNHELAERIYANPKFRADYGDLLEYHFSYQNSRSDSEVVQSQAKRLAEASLIMASSSDPYYRSVAFEVATVLFESMREELPGLAGFMRLLCTRLDNAPSVAMLDDESSGLPVNLDVESTVSIVKSTYQFGTTPVQLTRFQSESIELLNSGYSVSLSAPTSAGKSFLIRHFIASRFSTNEDYTAIVVVPTRALIRQLTREYQNTLRHYDLVTIGDNGNHVNVTTSSIEELTDSNAKRQLFILTPERLQAVLYSWQQVPQFDLFVVDESQKLGDSKRGIILEDTILELVGTEPHIQTVFLSPLSSNPEFLLSLLEPNARKEAVHSISSPVAQHIFSLSLEKGDRRTLYVQKLNSVGSERELQLHLSKSVPQARYRRIAFIANLLGASSSNILYSNGPVEAERIALALTELNETEHVPSPEVQETVSFLSSAIHEEYHLVTCLQQGNAYHYGSMPDIARISVEDLFSSNLIANVACTSTLLEGVNLPARNIFIEEPRLGSEPMDDGSFWNLAGRAGRLMKDFSGHVYCIFQDKWEKPVSERARAYKIQSSLNEILNDEHFVEYCREPTAQIGLESFQQAVNNLAARYSERGRNGVESFLADRINAERIAILVREVELLVDALEIPVALLKKNKSIDFRFQQRFLSDIVQLNDRELWALAPRQPFSTSAYETLQLILGTCDDYFVLEDRGRSYEYFTVIANKWIREESLREMINSSVDYERRDSQVVDVNRVIRKLIKSLNEDVRFHYVTTVKCYCDLLQFELTRRQISEDSQPSHIDFSLPNYLELGMAKEGTINLHNHGLSRTSAIEINRFCQRLGVPSKEVVKWVADRLEQVVTRMPRPVGAELLKVFA